jgi:hypothetical protein
MELQGASRPLAQFRFNVVKNAGSRSQVHNETYPLLMFALKKQKGTRGKRPATKNKVGLRERESAD